VRTRKYEADDHKKLQALSPLQRHILSGDKRGIERGGPLEINWSREYLAIEDKARNALLLLTDLAELDYHSLPKDRFERTLPEKFVIDFLNYLFGDASPRDKGKTLDPYGARLAQICAGMCIDKLIRQYQCALELGKEKQWPVLHDRFAREARGLKEWLSLIRYKVEDQAKSKAEN
jgi:hypothetical protein